MKRLSFFIIVAVGYSTLNAQIHFDERASNLGCGGINYGSGFLGGGISIFDYNQDGWDDITVSSGEGSPVYFLKNVQGSFIQETFNFSDDLFETKTVQWVDYDNDEDYDLFVTSNLDENRLYVNDGNFQFVNVTIPAGLQTTDHRTFGASWADYDKDGLLDLFINSRHADNNAMSNILYKNNGNGTFTDVSAAVGLSPTNHFSMCAAFFDIENDGFQDIFIANDRNPANQLYRNNQDNTFTEIGASSGINAEINAMSTAIGDYNRDGFMDIYVTNTIEGNLFYHNNGDGTFTDLAPTNGTIFNSVGWGANFVDADNDGDLDLYVSGELSGSVGNLPSAFYENDSNGNYTIPTNAGFHNDTARSFANAIGDINNDGLPDMVVLNYAPESIFIFQNLNSENNNWLRVKLEGVQSNWQGIGATLEISVNGNKQYNYTLLGEGYLGQNSAYEHFGIGQENEIDYLRITWPSGIVDQIINPQINTAHTFREGENVLSVSEHSSPTFTLVPNPSEEKTVIHITSQFLGSTLEVMDSRGRLINTFTITTLQTEIETGTLAKGVYYIRLQNNSYLETKALIVK